MNITQVVSRSSIVGQTYALMGVGLVLATITAGLGLHSQLSIITAIVTFVIAIGLMFGAMYQKESVIGLLCYFGFTGIMGYMTGPTIQHYLEFENGSMIVMQAIGATAVATAGLSLYAFISGKSFNQLGGFLFAGLLIVIVASIANIFLKSSLFDLTIACVSALIFCGYILYDTSRILSGEVNSPINGAISMFLNIINLFVNLLRIFGVLSSKD